ncbi:MAG: peptidoglycan DD-metalloendopeptidase family protein [Lachnospiraceae bacterium]|nr:peptidoglycan DD-metalloendopeptidase family protein [Lachnospiraceae bacterium]
MRRFLKKRYFILLGIWLLGLGVTGLWNTDLSENLTIEFLEKTYAKGKSSSEIQKEIEQKNAEQESAKKEKEQLENEIAEMEKKKGNVAEYIRELDEKSNELAEKIIKNQSSITKMKKEVKKLRREKKKAASMKENQYDTMKRRIKYMYENGEAGYLELLLGADSLSEFFNRAEYVSKVTGYDKRLFEDYQETCKVLAETEKEIKEKLAGLEEKKESLQVEEASVESLVEKKREEVARYQNLIADREASLGDTEVLLAAQENDLEKLFAAEREASAREEAEREAKRKEEEERAKALAAEKERQKNTAATQRPEEKPKETQPPSPTEEPAPAGNSTGGYQWPLTVAGRISSPFGPRSAPAEGASTFHKGVDIAVSVGTAVLATKAGTVITAAYSASAGNYVAISHGGGVYSYYMHCSSLNVSAGQTVSAGQQIALSGNSGISTGPHLHFALFMGGEYVNPMSYIQ